MILESTQILYTANYENGGTDTILSEAPLCLSTGTRGYKLHARNHPSVKWATESLAHYLWLADLALCLVKEYKHRFGNKEHACHEHIVWLRTHLPPGLLVSDKVQWKRDPPPAMPIEFARRESSVLAYRAYYNGPKRYLLKYTNRKLPPWCEPTTSTTSTKTS